MTLAVSLNGTPKENYKTIKLIFTTWIVNIIRSTLELSDIQGIYPNPQNPQNLGSKIVKSCFKFKLPNFNPNSLVSKAQYIKKSHFSMSFEYLFYRFFIGLTGF